MQTEYDGKILRNTVEFREILWLFGQMQTAHIALQRGTNCQVCLWQLCWSQWAWQWFKFFFPAGEGTNFSLQPHPPGRLQEATSGCFFELWPSFPWRRWQWSDGYDDGDFFLWQCLLNKNTHTNINSNNDCPGDSFCSSQGNPQPPDLPFTGAGVKFTHKNKMTIVDDWENKWMQCCSCIIFSSTADPRLLSASSLWLPSSVLPLPLHKVMVIVLCKTDCDCVVMLVLCMNDV